MTVEFTVRNTGKEVFLLPASRNDLEVLRAGNRDQRRLVVSLEYVHKESGKRMRACAGLAVGSESVAGSMISILPGATVSTHGVAVPDIQPWLPLREPYIPESGAAEVSVVGEIQFLEDTRVYLKSRSVAASARGIEVLWERPDDVR